MEEIFKQAQFINPDGSITIFNGYEVSNLGRIKSLNYKRTSKEKILKSGTYDKSGHQIVILRKDSKNYMRSVHRLVLSTFNLEGWFLNAVVDHIDSNPRNNRLDNLRWFTYKENANTEHARQTKSKAMKGRRHTEEAKKKISEANKGRYKDSKYKGSKHPQAQSCEYDCKSFNCIKEAYEYAKANGYTKCYGAFLYIIKKGSKCYQYDGRTFGRIKEAYEYAREHGYTKCYNVFYKMIKKEQTN